LSTTKIQKVLKELHGGTIGGHFATEITHKKIFNAGYKWPTMYRNVSDFYKSCDACQRIEGLVTQKFGHTHNNSYKGTIREMGLTFYGTN
jgi:hypothetical protein